MKPGMEAGLPGICYRKYIPRNRFYFCHPPDVALRAQPGLTSVGSSEAAPGHATHPPTHTVADASPAPMPEHILPSEAVPGGRCLASGWLIKRALAPWAEPHSCQHILARSRPNSLAMERQLASARPQSPPTWPPPTPALNSVHHPLGLPQPFTTPCGASTGQACP